MIRPTQFRQITLKPALYQVRAWGSDRYPDINSEWHEIPHHLHERYPYVDIQRLDSVPLSSLKDNLHGQT